MPKHLAEKAIEGSSYEVNIDWVDENGDAVVPTAMAWSLIDKDGNIINSRDAVSIASPASSETILLEGDDLKCSGNAPAKRYVYWNGTYTSTTHGAGKPLVDITSFDIEPIIQPRT